MCPQNGSAVLKSLKPIHSSGPLMGYRYRTKNNCNNVERVQNILCKNSSSVVEPPSAINVWGPRRATLLPQRGPALSRNLRIMSSSNLFFAGMFRAPPTIVVSVFFIKLMNPHCYYYDSSSSHSLIHFIQLCKSSLMTRSRSSE